MDVDINRLWVYAHAPTSIKDMALAEPARKKAEEWIANKSIPHILLCGSAGQGKTTFAKCIANDIGASVMMINASADNGIDVVRSKIIDFARTVDITGIQKIIILDEADNLSSAAQDALRNTIEDYAANTRFIFTANKYNKIIAPICSRCVEITVTPTKRDICRRLLDILRAENVTIPRPQQIEFLTKIINKYGNDIRKMVSVMQVSYIGDAFDYVDIFSAEDVADEIISVIDSDLDDFFANRKKWIEAENDFAGNYVDLSVAIAKRIPDRYPSGKACKMIVTINNYLCQSPPDPELAFAAMMIEMIDIANPKR